MRRHVLFVLLALPALLLAGCGGDGETQAHDTYPFTQRGYVFNWQGTSAITVELPDCIGTTGCVSPDFRNAAVAGITAWNTLLAEVGLATVNIVTSAPGSNDVKVLWDDGTGTSGYSIGPGVIGFAAVNTAADPSRYLVLTTRCNICGFTPHAPADIRAVAEHEWGHMMGVWNHSFDPADLMYPIYMGQPGRSPRDQATMRQSYRFAPDLNLGTLPPNSFTAPYSAPTPDDFAARFVYRLPGHGGPYIEFQSPAGGSPRHPGLP